MKSNGGLIGPTEEVPYVEDIIVIDNNDANNIVKVQECPIEEEEESAIIDNITLSEVLGTLTTNTSQ